jgi:U3 small nucleolar RNA-associated protein 14
MARTQGLQKKPGRRRPSLHKGNAAGYLKRHARKSLPSKNVSDVYEFEPENNRRSKISLDVGADEARNLAQDGSDEDEEDGRLKARLVGEQGDNDRIDSEDDEDVDSDAAFDESDDEKYAGHRLSRKVGFPLFVFLPCNPRHLP